VEGELRPPRPSGRARATLGSRNLPLAALSAEDRFAVVVTDDDAFEYELIEGHALCL
jgi:hypothetical protein